MVEGAILGCKDQQGLAIRNGALVVLNEIIDKFKKYLKTDKVVDGVEIDKVEEIVYDMNDPKLLNMTK